jgi:hypothetical protein
LSTSVLDIPGFVSRSALYHAGGYLIVKDLFAPDEMTILVREAESVRATSSRNVVEVSDMAEGRGGAPNRAFRCSPGTTGQWELLSHPARLARIADLTGILPVAIGTGTFTYYELPGDYLGLHRDVERCELTLITCLSGAESEGEGGLVAYPGFDSEPLSVVRAAGRQASVPVPLSYGESALLLGGIVAHEATPMSEGQSRTISIICYGISEI